MRDVLSIICSIYVISTIIIIWSLLHGHCNYFIECATGTVIMQDLATYFCRGLYSFLAPVAHRIVVADAPNKCIYGVNTPLLRQCIRHISI